MAARRRLASRRNWPDNLYKNSLGYYWYGTPKYALDANPSAPKSIGLGKDFRLACDQARAANAELLRRKGDVSIIQRLDGSMTLAAWCDEYEKRFIEKSGSKESTIATMKQQVKSLRNSSFAHKTVNQVETTDIADMIEKIELRGATMARHVLRRAVYVFRAAEAKGLIKLGENPAVPVELPKVTVQRSRLTLDEFNRVLVKVREEGYYWMENAMLLALISGQRREDISSMQFSQIKEGFLWVEQSKGRAGHEVKLRLPLSLRLDALGMSLEDVIKQCRDKVLSKHIIHHRKQKGPAKAGSYVKAETLGDTFKYFRNQAEISSDEGRTPPTFHEIRSLAARLYTEEYGAEVAQAILGHKSAKMTSLYRDTRGREWTEVKVRAR